MVLTVEILVIHRPGFHLNRGLQLVTCFHNNQSILVLMSKLGDLKLRNHFRTEKIAIICIVCIALIGQIVFILFYFLSTY